VCWRKCNKEEEKKFKTGRNYKGKKKKKEIKKRCDEEKRK
jgi:hypothetical protein